MKKPASLRAALVAAIPSLAAEPDRLAVFIDEGSIAATGGRSLSFEYRYTVHALVMDFAGDSDAVFVALVEWARANQPDLVTNAGERGHGITFEVDILNHTTVDLSVKLQLTEGVAVATGPDGERVIVHVDDSRASADRDFTWGCAAVDELSAVETWAGALLGQLSPAGRRTVMRDVARELRRSQQRRIAAQRNPDGSAYEPRKAKAVRKKARDKRGRIKRTAMFMKLRTARLMKVEAEADGFAVGFAGRVGRIARIHQDGERAPVLPGGPKYRYPTRKLLGLADTERQLIRNRLIAHITQ